MFYAGQTDYIEQLEALAASIGYAKTYTRSLPTANGSYSDICEITQPYLALPVRVTVSVDSPGFSVSKIYDLTFQWPNAYLANNVWYVARPAAESAKFGNEDFELLVKIDTSTTKASFRLRRKGTGGFTGTARIWVNPTTSNATVAALTTTGSDVSAYGPLQNGARRPAPVVRTANFTAVPGECYVIDANNVTATLPGSPVDGDRITFQASTSSITGTVIGRNGKTIEYLAEDMNADVANFVFDLVWVEAKNTWKIQ